MNILSFGEVLWDVYPEKNVIGGAPFNFSAHLAKLGAESALITAIGNDELGKQALRCIKEQKVSDAFAETSSYPTGACYVTLDDCGVPSYDLRNDMAYDHITLKDDQLNAVDKASYQAFYFGTLAQRNVESRQTLIKIVSRCHFEQVLFDINIRQQWYSRAILETGMRFCTILKFSREEAGVFEKIGIIKAIRKHFRTEEEYYHELCRELSQSYEISTVLLTLDKDGAMVYDKANNEFYHSEKPKGKVVSTVGAGDSFSACFLYQFLLGKQIQQCLQKAIILSDYVVQNTEAIPPYSQELMAELAR